MPQFVVCAPATGGETSSVSPCVDAGGEHYVPTVLQAASPGGFDLSNAPDQFGFGFFVVLTFWGIGVGCGAIFSVIRKGG